MSDTHRQHNAEFRWPLRVYIEDTDAGGIVFYVNYLKYMERARTEYLRSLGFGKNSFDDCPAEYIPAERIPAEHSGDGKAIFTEQLMFVVHAVAIGYHKPAHLDDELFATARILSTGAAQMRFEQRILRGSDVLCSGEVKIVCVDRRTFKPRRIPTELLTALSV